MNISPDKIISNWNFTNLGVCIDCVKSKQTKYTKKGAIRNIEFFNKKKLYTLLYVVLLIFYLLVEKVILLLLLMTFHVWLHLPMT